MTIEIFSLGSEVTAAIAFFVIAIVVGLLIGLISAIS